MAKSSFGFIGVDIPTVPSDADPQEDALRRRISLGFPKWGERNGAVLMSMRAVFLKRKDSALRSGAAADGVSFPSSHSSCFGARCHSGYEQLPFVRRKGNRALLSRERREERRQMAAVPVMAHPLGAVAASSLIGIKIGAWQRWAQSSPFTSGEEAVEVFGKVVMRGSCRVNELERL